MTAVFQQLRPGEVDGGGWRLEAGGGFPGNGVGEGVATDSVADFFRFHAAGRK